MTFMTRVLDHTGDLCADIRAMPFNTALAAGTLPQDVFRHYIIQDAHYLEGFGRALALAASRAPDAAAVAQLAGAGAGAIAVERQLHAHYMALYGVGPQDFAATPPSPVCSHYVSYLLAQVATRSIAEAVAALLPCFWIYRDVGQGIQGGAAADNPYAAWIETYASAEFDRAVAGMAELADRLAAAAPAAEVDRMIAAFDTSARLEWMFWDSAWHRRDWPDTRADGGFA